MTKQDAEDFETACTMAGVSITQLRWEEYLVFAKVHEHYRQAGDLDNFTLKDACDIKAEVEAILDKL